jgi:hypothetical protein
MKFTASRTYSDPEAAARLLAQKRQLIERLLEEPGPEEQEQIGQLLAIINRALELLEARGRVLATN